MKRMSKRRKWSFMRMQVAPQCGPVQLCGLRRLPLPLPQGEWRASPRAAGFGGGCLEGPGRDLRPGGPIRLVAVCRGGVALRALPSRLGRSGLLQCARVCVSAFASQNSSGGPHFGVRGLGSGVAGLCAVGVCWSPSR